MALIEGVAISLKALRMFEEAGQIQETPRKRNDGLTSLRPKDRPQKHAGPGSRLSGSKHGQRPPGTAHARMI